MDLAELLEQIMRSNASLFYGAGVTCSCGGPTWDELFSAVKAKFPDGRSDGFLNTSKA
jgi:hypothetical protein